jgi:LysR family glycine cleavage system transcriptional activator
MRCGCFLKVGYRGRLDAFGIQLKREILASLIRILYELGIMVKPLPSVPELQAFEAAARRLSFTEAARDLGLTQAAVSFRIKTLEGRLGVKLFERAPHLLLTESGRLYLPTVVDVLRRLERGTVRVVTYGVRRQRSGSTLRLFVTQAVASLWLIPRLGRFCEQNGGISLSVVSWIGGHSSIVPADFSRHNIDAAIVNSRIGTNWNGLQADKIISDCSVPVGDPSLLRAARAPIHPSHLKDSSLIHTNTWPDAWSTWLSAAGVADLEAKDNLWFQHTGLSVQAAMNGLGWAIAHGPLVARDIIEGRLVAPLRPFWPNGTAYYLVYPEESRDLGPVRTFKTWFRAEITRDINGIEYDAHVGAV